MVQPFYLCHERKGPRSVSQQFLCFHILSKSRFSEDRDHILYNLKIINTL